MDPVPAVVLAGGRTSAEFAREAGTPHRALADINGWPMARYVVHALARARTVGRVVLVGPPAVPDLPGADLRVRAEGGLVENIRAGMAECGGAPNVLIVTADIPFITPAAIDEHAAACAALGVDCCYTGVPREACEAQFAGMKRTYLRMPDRTLTGGNVVFQRVAAFERQAALLQAAYARRKTPLFLARLIGGRNVLKLLARRLTLEDIELAASRAMGVRCRIVVTGHASLGTDIDRPEDLRLARELLRPPDAAPEG